MKIISSVIFSSEKDVGETIDGINNKFLLIIYLI